MKDIKFKYWCESNSEMSGPYDLLDIGNSEGYSNDYIPVHGVQLQYTGAKDRNGREIYEGDMIKSVMNGVVEFNQGMFQVKKYSLHMYIQNGCEVIGNIYENSELLREITSYE